MTAPWMLAIVDGETEARYTEPPDTARNSGIVYQLITELIGEEAAKSTQYFYWRQWRKKFAQSKSHKRGITPSPKGYQALAQQAATFAREATTYGAAILLVDRDHQTDPSRLEEIRQGVAAASRERHCAVGEAVEDAESWLLADPSILDSPLPKPCEELWGDRDNPDSNHPKHVLRRCVLAPRAWTFEEAIAQWRFGVAKNHSPSLCAFIDELARIGREVFFIY
jgi:hypothetical protein